MADDLTLPELWALRVLAATVKLMTQVLDSTSAVWWPFLLSAGLIALAVFWLKAGRTAASLREFRRRFLGRDIWLHPSARADYAYYVVNGIVYPLVVAPLVIGGAALAASVQGGLAGIFGARGAPLLEPGLARAVYTLLFFVAYDFGRFAAHSLLHEMPLLWPFHKVHHSAEVLTPFTNYRAHPVDIVVMQTVPNLMTGLVSGCVWYLSAGEIGFYAFFGLHAGVAAFNAIGNLRHWHVWVSFGPGLNRWLISPAHHQIHHSVERRHLGKNRGFELAIWDRLFGTLYAPCAEERFTLGLGDGTDGTWHSVAKLYAEPFRDAWRSAWGWTAPAGAAATPAPARRRFLALGVGALGASLLPLPRAWAAGPQSVFMEDLTWIELRDAVAAGHTVAILPTGGIEQNGPHMALGKHHAIVRHTAGEIARRVGQALVAPVIDYVPEGRLDPPEGHMQFPGTLGVSEATFEAMLRDAAGSLALAGFTLICLLGDHGGSQAAQQKVAAELSREWRRRGVRVVNLQRYYAANGQEEWLKSQGFAAGEIGTHAGLLDTAELMAVAPGLVRGARLSPKAWPAGPTGAAGDPSRASAEIGARLMALKIDTGVAEIRDLAALGPAPEPRHWW
ncbi:MAG TPA: creatininase family protein [Alphaproteobacteria bacterium]